MAPGARLIVVHQLRNGRGRGMAKGANAANRLSAWIGRGPPPPPPPRVESEHDSEFRQEAKASSTLFVASWIRRHWPLGRRATASELASS